MRIAGSVVEFICTVSDTLYSFIVFQSRGKLYYVAITHFSEAMWIDILYLIKLQISPQTRMVKSINVK